jgi:hypothetical protein
MIHFSNHYECDELALAQVARRRKKTPPSTQHVVSKKYCSYIPYEIFNLQADVLEKLKSRFRVQKFTRKYRVKTNTFLSFPYMAIGWRLVILG